MQWFIYNNYFASGSSSSSLVKKNFLELVVVAVGAATKIAATCTTKAATSRTSKAVSASAIPKAATKRRVCSCKAGGCPTASVIAGAIIMEHAGRWRPALRWNSDPETGGQCCQQQQQLNHVHRGNLPTE